MMSKWNVPDTYKDMKKELRNVSIPERPVFAYFEGEKFVKQQPQALFVNDEVVKTLDDVDYEIVTRVAASKYLTSLQVYEFMSLSSVSNNREAVYRRLHKLMSYRILQEYELTREGAERGIKVYCLDFIGNKIAYEKGVVLHKGIKYISEKKRKELGIALDTAEDVKRVLVGNQILLGYLKSKIQLVQFGIMETHRIQGDNSYETAAIIRTALTVRIDSENILIYEVVRDNENGMCNLAEKILRYYKLLSLQEFLILNKDGNCAYPQMVICGENLDHNKRIYRYLHDRNIMRDNDDILFTEDLLNLGDVQRSIYGFNKDEMQEWYLLPKEYEYKSWIA